jgi:hypothetical protein
LSKDSIGRGPGASRGPRGHAENIFSIGKKAARVRFSCLCKSLILLGLKIACQIGILLKAAPLLALRAVKGHFSTPLSTVGVDKLKKRFKNGSLRA